MRLPSPVGLFFLAYLLVLLPWLARRSATLMRGTEAVAVVPSRLKVWSSTLFLQLMLLLLAWLTGREFDYRIFDLPHVGAREYAAGGAALVAQLVLREVSWRSRSEAERFRLPVLRLIPRTALEWLLFGLTALVAGVAEEAAYRGVAMSILWWATGSAWVAVLLCSLAFALAHAVQGGRSMLIVFLMALLMHALVQFTGTLVIAMVVHATYDLLSGWLARRQALKYAPDQ